MVTTSSPVSPAVLMYMKNQMSPERRSKASPQTGQRSRRRFHPAKSLPSPHLGQR